MAARRAEQALESIPPRLDTRLLFPAARGGYVHLGNWRRRDWHPALEAAGLAKRGPYALRHTFITNALAAGIPTFDVARYAGTSVAMIDRTYDHLAHGSEELLRTRLAAFAVDEQKMRPTDNRCRSLEIEHTQAVSLAPTVFHRRVPALSRNVISYRRPFADSEKYTPGYRVLVRLAIVSDLLGYVREAIRVTRHDRRCRRETPSS